MKYGAIAALLFAMLMGGLVVGATAQTVRLAPEKPAWGATLRIFYDPAAPGALFRPEDEVRVNVYQMRDDQSAAREDRLLLRKEGTALVAEVEIAKGVGHVQLTFFRPPNEYDNRARRSVMIYRSDGQPARGANLSQANSRDYLAWIERELALYPDNYLAYRTKWRMAQAGDPAGAAEMVRADLAAAAPLVRGEPLAWLQAQAYGHLVLRQEEKSREALRKMVDRFPDARATRIALDEYWYQASAQKIPGEGPQEVAQMYCALMKRYPGSEFARQTIGDFAWRKETALDVTEAVARLWAEEQPANPLPHYHHAIALRVHGRPLEQIAAEIEKALDLFVRKTVWDSDVSAGELESKLRAAYQMAAEIAWKQERYSRAIGAVRAAQAMTRERGGDLPLLEGRIWRDAGLSARALPAFLEAWRRGAPEAERELQLVYAAERGAPDGFAAWLAKKTEGLDAQPEARTRFAPFAAITLAGAKRELSALRGKVVVLNFWFVGCAPCKTEIPALNRLVRENAGREVVFLAIALDSAESLRAFLQTTPFEYEIVPDGQALTDQLGIRAFPMHYVLNPRGEIEAALRGGGEKTIDQLRHAVQRLLPPPGQH